MARFNFPIGTAGRPAPKSGGHERGGREEVHTEQVPDDATTEESPEQVAQTHGPAVEVHMSHEHEMGSHHVHSVHQDGYEHHSDHGSVEEAHEHAKKLAGHEHSEEAIHGLKKFAQEEEEE
jgi:hypothetical protein